jgi:hypothetical protein
MALFQAQILQEDRKPISVRTLLLNTDRVVDAFMNSDSDTIFFYRGCSNITQKRAEYKYNGTGAQFIALLNEAGTPATFITLRVNKLNNQKPAASEYVISVADIIKAENKTSNPNECLLWVSKGLSERSGVLLFDIPYTIAELDSGVSGSGSMS